MSRVPPPGALLSVLAIVIAGAGIAGAANPEPDGSIRACIRENSAVRIVTDTQPCAGDEQTITFNAPGAATGPTGPAGENGKEGRSGFPCSPFVNACKAPPAFRRYSPRPVTESVYRAESMTLERLGKNNNTGARTVACLPTETRTAGGYELLDIDSGSSRQLISIRESAPSSGNGWTVSARNDSAEQIRITLYVICARAAG